MIEYLDVPAETHESVERWLDAWNIPELAARARVEWSPRLTRSLGRCYPERRLIRIATHVGEADKETGLLDEVLCHELAHLAAFELHGPHVRPHGAEWKALMRAAGYEPKTRLKTPPGIPPPSVTRRPKRRAPSYLYVHRCPVCHRYRVARRLMKGWRCASCIQSGLTGELVITRATR